MYTIILCLPHDFNFKFTRLFSRKKHFKKLLWIFYQLVIYGLGIIILISLCFSTSCIVLICLTCMFKLIFIYFIVLILFKQWLCCKLIIRRMENHCLHTKCIFVTRQVINVMFNNYTVGSLVVFISFDISSILTWSMYR